MSVDYMPLKSFAGNEAIPCQLKENSSFGFEREKDKVANDDKYKHVLKNKKSATRDL